MKKNSFLINVFKDKCPRCQEGDLFIKPFSISNPVNMPEKCPVCQQRYEPEPGFYFGAMFISYIITGFLFLGIMALAIIVFKLSVLQAMFVLVFIAAVTNIFFMRFARSLWINMMVPYDPKAKVERSEQSFGY